MSHNVSFSQSVLSKVIPTDLAKPKHHPSNCCRAQSVYPLHHHCRLVVLFLYFHSPTPEYHQRWFKKTNHQQPLSQRGGSKLLLINIIRAPLHRSWMFIMGLLVAYFMMLVITSPHPRDETIPHPHTHKRMHVYIVILSSFSIFLSHSVSLFSSTQLMTWCLVRNGRGILIFVILTDTTFLLLTLLL